jgi:hypothetical protein
VVFAELLPAKLGRGKSSGRAFGLFFVKSKSAGSKLTTASVTAALTAPSNSSLVSALVLLTAIATFSSMLY